MAAVFISFISPLKQNPCSALHREINSRPLSSASLSPLSRPGHVSAVRTDLRRCSLSIIGGRFVFLNQRLPCFLPLAAHEELNHSDIELEKESELKSKEDQSQEEWKKTLESFKEEALKMKEMSQEAYEVYSKRAIIILKETSEVLKIQADKARDDLGIITKELSQEGQIYLSTAAENSPESVKDVLEIFSSYPRELKEYSKVRDFYLGVPYGAFLAIGGFLNFMLTGSIPAIRFGVILGSSLLALSISSLRSWKSGQSSELFLKGQAAIATILFIREWRLFFKVRSFPSSFMTLLSGAMVAFYVYRILIDDTSKNIPSSDNSSEE